MTSAFASSEFNDLFTEVTADLGEQITLGGTSFVTVTALIDIGSVVADSLSDEVPELTGFIRVKTEDAQKVIDAGTVIIRSQEFHINGNGTDEHGIVTFNVLRREHENQRTNLFDLNDEQAVWHDT
jgi:hypothetical protein